MKDFIRALSMVSLGLIFLFIISCANNGNENADLSQMVPETTSDGQLEDVADPQFVKGSNKHHPAVQTRLLNRHSLPKLTNQTEISFQFSCNYPSCTYQCRLDQGLWESCTSPKSYSGLLEGLHTFLVQATNEKGMTEPSPLKYKWKVDLTAPETIIISSPSDPTSELDAVFEFVCTNGTNSNLDKCTFECRLDNGLWEVCFSPKSYHNLAEATHLFEVRAKDPAGNVDPSPASFSWSID